MARALGRRCILIEASATYTTLARTRLGWASRDAFAQDTPHPPPRRRQQEITTLPLFASMTEAAETLAPLQQVVAEHPAMAEEFHAWLDDPTREGDDV